MPLYDATVPQLKKMLGNLERWFDKAEAYAQSKDFSPDRYLEFRLAPDMFSWTRQIQAACDTAKFAAARLAGKDAPKHPDEETTFQELRARVRSVIDYLDGFSAGDFEGADERIIRLPFLPEGKGVRAGDYLNAFALPNFYFHLATAYDILRHNGVDVGKRDFLGGIGELVDV
ncbi:MAG: DUF1993 domain-containing protein [Myxococcota bacterium]